MDLSNFWSYGDSKQLPKQDLDVVSVISRPRNLVISALFVLGIGMILGLSLDWIREHDPTGILANPATEIDLPEVILNPTDITNRLQAGDINLDADLKVVSANLIGIYEQPPSTADRQQPAGPDSADREASSEASAAAILQATPTPAGPVLAGIRILGEVKNVSGQTISDAQVLIRYYNQQGKLIATKLGHWKEPYQFVSLPAGETVGYDVLTTKPPAAGAIVVEFEARSAENKAEFKQELFMLGRKVEPVTVDNQGQETTYYTLSGVLVNRSQQELQTPGIYAWMKNEGGRVIGLGVHNFSADLLPPEASVSAQLNIIPVEQVNGAPDVTVKTFAATFDRK